MLLAWLAAALAAPAVPVTSYDGTYALSCDEAWLTLDLAVAIGGPGGAGGWSGSWSVQLPCAVPERRIQAYARGVDADCRAAGVPAASCRELGIGVYRALLPFGRVGEAIVPATAALTVDPAGLFDLHTMNLVYGWSDGAVASGQLLLDNTAGVNAGHFGGFGIDPGLTAAPGCVVPVAASIDGWFDLASFDVDAVYSVSGHQICAGALTGGAWWGIELGLGGTVDVVGYRAP